MDKYINLTADKTFLHVGIDVYFMFIYIYIYIYDLSVKFNECFTGRLVGDVLFNHLIYTDDLMLKSTQRRSSF